MSVDQVVTLVSAPGFLAVVLLTLLKVCGHAVREMPSVVRDWLDMLHELRLANERHGERRERGKGLNVDSE